MSRPLSLAALLTTTIAAALPAGSALAQDVTLTIESWRNDDLTLWQEQIIPAFEASHPGIKVKFVPSAPTEYNAVLNSKLDAGSAGHQVGYESQSQFSREYARQYGEPPLRDVGRTRRSLFERLVGGTEALSEG